MITALNDAAFSPYLTPEQLWRASCSWAAQGASDHAEWLHEMSVELIDILGLPTYEPVVQQLQQGLQSYVQPTPREQLFEIHELVGMDDVSDDDIPF